jgi:hypothetical protein
VGVPLCRPSGWRQSQAFVPVPLKMSGSRIAALQTNGLRGVSAHFERSTGAGLPGRGPEEAPEMTLVPKMSPAARSSHGPFGFCFPDGRPVSEWGTIRPEQSLPDISAFLGSNLPGFPGTRTSGEFGVTNRSLGVLGQTTGGRRFAESNRGASCDSPFKTCRV